MQNLVKIDQTVLEIMQLINFEDGSGPLSWILKISNF